MSAGHYTIVPAGIKHVLKTFPFQLHFLAVVWWYWTCVPLLKVYCDIFPKYVGGIRLSLKLMWVQVVIVRYRDTASFFLWKLQNKLGSSCTGEREKPTCKWRRSTFSVLAKFTDTQYGPTISGGKTLKWYFLFFLVLNGVAWYCVVLKFTNNQYVLTISEWKTLTSFLLELAKLFYRDHTGPF